MQKHITHSPDETMALANKFAGGLSANDVVALTGELGAGKTQFVKGMAGGLGIPENMYVRSPTFILMNEYRGGKFDLYHFDFYRLNAADQLDDLGLDEYFENGGITVIEWADKFPRALPEKTVYISFKVVDERTREITVASR